MSNVVRDFRVWVVLFLVAALVMLAAGGWGIAEPGASQHEAGMVQFPRADCGDNFFKVFLTPRGEECFTRGDSAARVEAEMQKQDPTIFDEGIDYVTPERWYEALTRALTALGW